MGDRSETRGRFVIEMPGELDGGGSILQKSFAGPSSTSIKKESGHCITTDRLKSSSLVEFIGNDKGRRKKRLKLLALTPHCASFEIGDWSHLGEPSKRTRPPIQPLVVKSGDNTHRTVEFSRGVPAPLIVNSENPAAAFTRKALTLLPGGGRKNYPDIACTYI